MRQQLTYESIISNITKICQKKGIKLVLNDPDIEEDNGIAYDGDEIHLSSKYSHNLILLAIFFHEYSHCLIYRRKGKRYEKMSIFREESMCWVLAMELQIKYFNKQFTKKQGNFMIDCLKTYSKDHYTFRKRYPREEDYKLKEKD